MSLKERIQQDVKDAMRAKDKARLGVLRMLSAEIKQREVDQRIVLDDSATLQLLEKMIKQRRDAAKQYENAGRKDLWDQEEFEITVLQGYMPEALSDDEIGQMVQSAIEQSGASSMKDMGKVMAILRPQVQGRADMGAVSAQVKAKLS